MFKLLDTLKSTAPGLDNIPSWFLRLSAPILARPLARLYNLSLTTSTVPTQWKTSVITPVAKVSHPTACSDYRPISITPIVSRLLEKLIVRHFLYPIFTDPNYSKLVKDQFAFRPTGSTTAALINLLHLLTNLLQTYPYVHLIALDFSKAFDTVRHSTLLEKCCSLPIGDNVYNWLISYLENREHCTKFNGTVSATKPINASIVQGSGIGPLAFVITASDLKPKFVGNHLNKYADDSILIVPSINTNSMSEELVHVANWAKINNLKLNFSKTKEIITRRPKFKLKDLPPTLP